jgi:hypothetical protein
MIYHKKQESVEYFKYFWSRITSDEGYTHELKSKVAMAKATFNKKKTLFASKLALNLRKNVEFGAF